MWFIFNTLLINYAIRRSVYSIQFTFRRGNIILQSVFYNFSYLLRSGNIIIFGISSLKGSRTMNDTCVWGA